MNVRIVLLVLFSLRSSHSCLAHTSRGSRCPRVCLISSMHEANVHSSTLNSPFHSYSYSSYSPSTSCYPSTSTRSSSKIPCASSPRRWGSTDESFSNTGYEPKDYYLTETYVESLTESLTEQRLPEQRLPSNGSLRTWITMTPQSVRCSTTPSPLYPELYQDFC